MVLPSFVLFGQAVSEEKNFFKLTNQKRNKNCLLRQCLFTDRDEMCTLYRGPSIATSYKVLVNLAKRFQGRSFRN
jgi:hypothetical protein